MNTINTSEIARYYINMYNTYSLQELKDSLEFFINRGCNANNNNKQEYKIHINVLKNCLETKLK